MFSHKIAFARRIIIFVFLINCVGVCAQSIYPFKITDKKAVYFLPGQFPIHADGIQDDSDALQQAIDRARDKGIFGIVFIPEGTYKLSKTVYVWKGIRLIGYGKNRPVFIRDGNDGPYNTEDSRYVIYFANNKSRNGSIRDANPSTFYSAISNIDFEVKNGNTNMVGIRSNYAQHCFISYCNFNMGTALAAIEKIGNEVSNCRFINGKFGVLASKTSPGWPFVLLDSYFEGQTKAAIETSDAGLTIIRTHFKNTGSAIITRPNQPEKLFMEDCRFENISHEAIIVDDEYNSYSQYNIKNLICLNVPFLASFRKSKKEIKVSNKYYKLADFMHGLHVDGLGSDALIETIYNTEPLSNIPSLPISDVPMIPSQKQWVNIADLGAVGDSEFDNTAILQEAINKHEVLYFPSGRYRISNTLVLKNNTVLIGLSPITTQILISDNTPNFTGIGKPKPLIESSQGGNNIISGLGIDTGGINPRAVGIKWMAGENSLVNDIKFLGGHGTYDTEGNYLKIYNNNRTADSDNNRKWDSQYWSLWVTNNGGGTFKDIWTASPFAQAGFYVSNTSTPGRVYGMSLEHHVRNEAQFKNVSNWKVYAFQFEEEPGEGWNALPLEVDNCTNLRFANVYFYRTSRTQSSYPYAIKINNAVNLEFCNVHSYSSTRFVFDNTLFDEGLSYGLRALEISNVKIKDGLPKIEDNNGQPKVKKIADGFEFIDGLTSDRQGNVYFADSRWHEIYKYSIESKLVTLICDLPIFPSGLVVDKSNNLLVKTNNNGIVSLDMNSNPIEDFKVLSKDTLLGTNQKWGIYPAYIHSSVADFYDKLVTNKVEYYHNKDANTTLVNTLESREPYNLSIAIPGKTFYLVQDEIHKTYGFNVALDGSLSDPVVFAERGDYQAIEGADGNVYIVAENILVYAPDGEFIREINIPQRPSSIAFGGDNGNFLFITARDALYSIKIK